jgi:hypothetical protein
MDSATTLRFAQNDSGGILSLARKPQFLSLCAIFVSRAVFAILRNLVILRAVAGSTLRFMDSATTLRFAQNDSGGYPASGSETAVFVIPRNFVTLRNLFIPRNFVILRAVAGSTLRSMDSATTLRFAQNDSGGYPASGSETAIFVFPRSFCIPRNLCHPAQSCHPAQFCHPAQSCHPARSRRIHTAVHGFCDYASLRAE